MVELLREKREKNEAAVEELEKELSGGFWMAMICVEVLLPSAEHVRATWSKDTMDDSNIVNQLPVFNLNDPDQRQMAGEAVLYWLIKDLKKL